MKKLLIAVVIGLLLVAALATTALADNGPHGGFTNTNTDACASCHRAHEAQGQDSLLKVDEASLCESCHDGSGAYTDVLDGTYNTLAASSTGSAFAGTGSQGESGAPLFAGGFDNTKMTHAWSYKSYYDTSTTLASSATTSSHRIGSTGTIWGAGAFSGTANTGQANFTLECTDCHNPHGNAGLTSTGAPAATYRILRFQPTGSSGFNAGVFTAVPGVSYSLTGASGGATVDDIVSAASNNNGANTHWYTINSNVAKDQSLAVFKKPFSGSLWQSVSFAIGAYAPGARGAEYKRPAVSSFSASYSCSWANAAGNDYRISGLVQPPPATNNCGSITAVAAADKFDNTNPRYGMSMFCVQCHDRYFADSESRSKSSGDAIFKFRHASATSSIACVDCHVAHGTSAVETSLSGGTGVLLAVNGGPVANNSALLRLDAREMCASCHAASVNVTLTNN